jgi:hypothetical protein
MCCEHWQLQKIQEELVPSLDLLQNIGLDEGLIFRADLHELHAHAGLLERTRFQFKAVQNNGLKFQGFIYYLEISLQDRVQRPSRRINLELLR